MPPLVSILTPCYNGAGYIDRLLSSVLAQDYPNVEMIVIDDGSTDNSRAIIERRIPEFENRGYALSCISQPNGGQSVAIDNGLKIIQGRYLAWPDMDDFYADRSTLSRMVEVLERSDDTVSMVRGLPQFLNEHTLAVRSRQRWRERKSGRTNLFEDCLYACHGYWYPPVCYMAKVTAIDECIPERKIYTAKNAGQNWQMMLPLLYRHECITLPTYLSNVLVRQASHSRGQYKTFEQIQDKLDAYENTIIATLSGMSCLPEDKRSHYQKSIRRKYLFERLDNCLYFGRHQEAREIIDRLKCEFRCNVVFAKINYWCSYLPCYYRGRRLLSRVIRKLRSFI